MNTENQFLIELSRITPEYKLHYLIKENINPIFAKDICNEYEKCIYDYYNFIIELSGLINKRKLLILSCFDMQNRVGTIFDFYCPDLFPYIREQIITTHRKIQCNKNIILNNWNVYNNILNKYIIKYG